MALTAKPAPWPPSLLFPFAPSTGRSIHARKASVQSFQEKPTIRDYWINAGFFVFEKRAFDLWEGMNLENQVLPKLADAGVLYTHLHEGFWKSMDTSKDQQEFETILTNGEAPWMKFDGLALRQAAS